MQKKVKIKCRESDPDFYKGTFKVDAEFVFEKERELRLEDGRIIVIKKIGDRTSFIVYHENCLPARDHKVKDVQLLYAATQYAHS